MTREKFKAFMLSPWLHSAACRDHKKSIEKSSAALEALKADPSNEHLREENQRLYAATFVALDRIFLLSRPGFDGCVRVGLWWITNPIRSFFCDIHSHRRSQMTPNNILLLKIVFWGALALILSLLAVALDA